MRHNSPIRRRRIRGGQNSVRHHVSDRPAAGAAAERSRRPRTWNWFDRALPGFGLRVHRSGAKAWIVQTRIEGKSRRVVIARHGEMDLAQARRRVVRRGEQRQARRGQPRLRNPPFPDWAPIPVSASGRTRGATSGTTPSPCPTPRLDRAACRSAVPRGPSSRHCPNHAIRMPTCFRASPKPERPPGTNSATYSDAATAGGRC